MTRRLSIRCIYLGAFAEKNAFEDIIVVLTFGFLGWVMVQMEKEQ